jgi:TatD family-associated radical SAM protein
MSGERTILYWGGDSLYVNLTSRCSAGCVFCLRAFTWEVFGAPLRLSVGQEPEAAEVIDGLEREFLDRVPSEVVFAGLGEPTLRFDVLVTVTDWLRTRRLPSRLNTNGHGQLINPDRDVVGELARAGLGAASVSLNAHDEATYDLVCRPTFSKAFRAVTAFIRTAAAGGIEVTATAVDVPDVDLAVAERLAHDLGAAFRVRALIPPPAPTVS